MRKLKLTPGRRFVFAVGRKKADGTMEYCPSNPYTSLAVGLERAKTFSQRGGATSRAKHRNYRVKPGEEWVVVPCEVFPMTDAAATKPDEPQRYILVTDNSMHRFVIPVEREKEWDEFCSIPEDDPLSWTPPPWADQVEGVLTFTDPRTK